MTFPCDGGSIVGYDNKRVKGSFIGYVTSVKCHFAIQQALFDISTWLRSLN